VTAPGAADKPGTGAPEIEMSQFELPDGLPWETVGGAIAIFEEWEMEGGTNDADLIIRLWKHFKI
jgi:hypothetical protein